MLEQNGGCYSVPRETHTLGDWDERGLVLGDLGEAQGSGDLLRLVCLQEAE